MPRAFPLEGMPNFRAYAQVNFGGQNAQNWALGHLGISLGIGHGLGINLKKNKTRIPLLDNIYLKETFPQFKLIRGNLKYFMPREYWAYNGIFGQFCPIRSGHNKCPDLGTKGMPRAELGLPGQAILICHLANQIGQIKLAIFILFFYTPGQGHGPSLVVNF